MFDQELENQLFKLANHGTAEEKQTMIDEIIAWLPEKNAQGEIKAEIDEELALVEVSETNLIYKRMANKPANKKGLYFNFNRDGSTVEYYEIPVEWQQENPDDGIDAAPLLNTDA